MPSSRYPRRIERRFRPGVVVFGVVIAVGGLVAALIASRPDPPPDPRAGSRLVAGPAANITRTPLSYRVVYRLEDTTQSTTPRLTTEKLWVRRPFDSRVETLEGPPPGRALLSSQRSSFTRLATGSPTADETLLVIAPEMPASDLRLAGSLSDTLAISALERRETREVLGRRCQVYRSAQPLGAGLLPPPFPDGEYAESCVDEAGLLLEEVFVIGNRPVRRKVAIEVEEDAELLDDLFRIEGTPTIPVKSGGGSVRQVVPTSRTPGDFYVLDSPPAGFELYGRYAVVPPSSEPQVADLPGGRSGSRLGAVYDVWVRGADILMVDQGGTASGARPFSQDQLGHPEELGGLGTGEVVPGPRLSQARAQLRGGRYLRVVGTLPPPELAAVARSLRKVEGPAELVFMD